MTIAPCGHPKPPTQGGYGMIAHAIRKGKKTKK